MISNYKQLFYRNRCTNIMSYWIRIPIHSRRTNGSNPIKLFYWHYLTWYILRRCPFPLRTIDRSSICNYSRSHSLVTTLIQYKYKPKNNKNSIFFNIYRSKHNIFPATLLRTKWNTTTILRLPRCFYNMKYCFFPRIFNFIHIYYHIHMNYLRKTKSYPPSDLHKLYFIFYWMNSIFNLFYIRFSCFN